MINKLITDSSFYNITKSNNNISTNSSNNTKSSNVANKYIDTVQQFSNTTKNGKSVSNTYNNVVKNYDSIVKNSNSSNNENSATENVDPDKYNIPIATVRSDYNGDTYHTGSENDGVLYSGGITHRMVFDIRYAEHSTDENPIMSARGQDENGEEFTQLITVNKVNPSNATPVEIIALQSHLYVGQDDSLIGDSFLMGGVYGYDEHGYNLNDRNNYTLSLEMNIILYSHPTYHAPQVPIDLSSMLDSFKDFMNKNNIVEHDNSLEIKNAYAKKMLENASNELNDLSKSMSKDKGDLDDEFLKLLDENKDDNNDK